ncbi:LysE/ArgO family amino acid transporter [Vibrio gallicus]|uniref:LysE/ArgO family amino acid transporter n=1 Tax=Vibrio gallicus TaxID=190897 RepID=UPI0021C33A64|nr:LysE/ArgO family amino acid transporter [Vibrio gallicus]
MIHSLLTGALISGSLIVAIGSQNAFLLKCSLTKQHPMSVATVCFIGDIILISTGVLGIGTLLYHSPLWRDILTISGVIFLFWYGSLSAKSAWQGTSQLSLTNKGTNKSWLQLMLMTAAITFLNPHVYIDTVVILGGVTSSMTQQQKVWFVVGALMSSGIWFYGVAYFSKVLIPLFERPRMWQILDTIIAVIMFGIAIKLALPLVT